MRKLVVSALGCVLIGVLMGAGVTYAAVRKFSRPASTSQSMAGMSHMVMPSTDSNPATSNTSTSSDPSTSDDMSMKEMTSALQGKTGDAFDKAFVAMMIQHHQGAIDMANQAKVNAKHEEIKTMADAIISAQTSEIAQMKAWQTQWGY